MIPTHDSRLTTHARTPIKYPVTPGHPPLGVAVVVIWDGRAPFVAARAVHPTSKRRGWLTNDTSDSKRGRPVFLPCRDAPRDPSRPYAGWHTLKGDAPDCWWPQHPDKWQAPLPEPLPQGLASHEGRMWSERTRFQAVEDAEAEELARDMEADRQAARARGEDPNAAELPEKQWWLDPHLVTYSAAGSISEREAEGRLMRALNTERWVSVDRPGDGTFTPEDAIAWRLGQPEPNGRDRDDMLTALGWLAALETDPRAEKLMRLRSSVPAMTWRRIGKGAGLSAAVARRNGDTLLAVTTRLHAWALGELTREANGEETPGGAKVRARLARLQAGNAAARLQE